MPKDRLQADVEVGQVVNVPMVITSVGGTPQQPTLTGTLLYKSFAGTNASLGPVDAIQVTLEE